MLYAYLLTRTDFVIEQQPESTSADKRFAHKVYIDLLFLLLELTGHNSEPAKPNSLVIDKKLKDSATGKSLAANSDLKSIIRNNDSRLALPAGLLQQLVDQITDSPVYKEFKRRRGARLDDEIELLCTVFETLISRNENLVRLFRDEPGYTKIGYEMGVDKFVRTLRNFGDIRSSYTGALKALDKSLLQAHKLYISIFALIVKLTQTRTDQLETARHKFLATDDDKNPNTRFVDNMFADALAYNSELQKYVKEYGIYWFDDITFLSSLLDSILKSPVYEEYMAMSATDWEKDCEFWRQILKTVVFPSDALLNMLEDTSVFWNDDLHIIGTFVLKSIRLDAQNQDHTLTFLPQYKDEEDSRFGAELFELAVKNREQYESYVEKFVDKANWDAERIAFMDNVILVCAVCEIINFPKIPLAVSLNEYIDIAKLYSSAKSGQFINGMLYNIIEYLKTEGIINK